MNLLSIIVILLAIATAGAIVYIAWEISSDKPRIERTGRSTEDNPEDPPQR